MKLRIKGNSIRIRLSQSEVNQFGENEICFDKVSFGLNELTYQLHMADVDEVTTDFENNTISVAVPYALAQQWVNTNTMVGFNHKQTYANNKELLILVEKDFQCLATRPNEDESDNFPNPSAGELKC
ncbi:MAG: DUF7009 family protein [Bacteroidia bacterium]